MERDNMSLRTTSIDLHNPYCTWDSARRSPGEGLRAVQVWTRGQAWADETYLEGKALAGWLCEALSNQSVRAETSFAQALHRLNGSFALVAQTPDGVLAAVDRLRSIPLFYGIHKNGVVLSDSAERARRLIHDTDLDRLAVKEFLLTGYVTGAYTLLPNVRQIQAGELVSIEDTKVPRVSTTRYYRFQHGNYFRESREQIYGRLEEILFQVFERLVRSTKGQRIVVPLSGGFDSRLIVVMLKLLQAENVLCFSYGRSNNWESKISREVAKRLGYEWRFVPYTRKRWRKWFQAKECRVYSRYGGAFVSSPVLQDWAAVWEMKATNWLRDDDVLVPGHTGDFISGGHIPHYWSDSDSVRFPDVIRAILNRHYALWKWMPDRGNLGAILATRIKETLQSTRVNDVADAASAFERWDWQERQAKFIANNARVYEFWGYDWRIPLWDCDMMNFWAQVPLKWRIGKKLYDEYLETRLFPRVGVQGLHQPRQSGCRGRMRTRMEKLHSPFLGRYGTLDFAKWWWYYTQEFGNGLKSTKCFLNPNTLNVSIFLPEWAQYVRG